MLETDVKLSEHFTLFELCNVKKYGRYNEPSPFALDNLKVLAKFLDTLRYALTRPIIVNSAFRNVNINRHVGGVPNSDHIKGLAADIRVIGLTPIKLARFIRDNALLNARVGQVIIYPTFVHVSINRYVHKSVYLIKKGSRYEKY
jgi:Uncharacterized protein conserved in bacteria|nr:MAG TPA: peptidase [Microviridae sp.]